MSCPSFTLSETVDGYLIRRFSARRKNYDEYLIIAQDVWKDLFWNTFWVTKNTWVTVQGGDPYNYINMPTDCTRFFSMSIPDKCGDLKPLYYNSKLSTIPKPTVKKCGCESCDCGDTCSDVNSFTVTTKAIDIGGTTYYEKTYLKYCKNGDVLEYIETPTKKYTTIVQTADYNIDYNRDYDAAPTFSPYTIVNQITTRLVCTLETKPCGCPVNNTTNNDLILNKCGCSLGCFNQQKCCDTFMQNVNYDKKTSGQIKFSEEGDKIFIKDLNTADNPFVLISYQTDGVHFDEEIQVPDYGRAALWAGLDYESKRYNDKYRDTEKEEASRKYVKEVNKLIMFLNPLSMEVLSTVQNSKILW